APQHARQHAARLHALHQSRVTQRLKARQRRNVWPLAAGGAGALAAVVLLAFLLGGSPEPPKPPQVVVVTKTERVTVPAETPKAAAPKDDPAQTAAAEAVFTRAEEFSKQERWVDVLTELKKLGQKPYSDLQTVKARSTEVGKLVGLATSRLQAAEEAREAQIEGARTAMREGRYKEAHGVFQEFVRGGRKDLLGSLERCERELESGTLLEEMRSALGAKRWDDVQTRILLMGQKFRDADTVARNKTEIWEAMARSGRELEAVKLFTEAHAAAAGMKWADVSRLLVEIEKRRETETYKARADDLTALRNQVYKANEREAEDLARNDWPAAVRDYSTALNDKRYEQAVEALEGYVRVHGSTKEHQAHAAEIATKIADAQRRKAKERDDEARKLFAGLQNDLKRGAYDQAFEAIQKLQSEYADLAYVKGNDRLIRGYKAQLEGSGKIGPHIVVEMDFEDLPGGWTTRGGAAGAVNADEPHQGRRAARLTLTSDTRAFHPIFGLSRAEQITFWARMRVKGPMTPVSFMVVEDSAMNSYTYAATFTPTTDWKLYTFRLGDFRFYGSSTMATRKLSDFSRVHNFGFGFDESVTGTMELQIDTLRAEAPRR
ncbi:MAG TPA: carbohydrate binding domain-containing protein, partial [Planctomycetota bacterium]|nr:carbohydrate binding domain-containing protein [Planctomycetota bacterium]